MKSSKGNDVSESDKSAVHTVEVAQKRGQQDSVPVTDINDTISGLPSPCMTSFDP
jgi:hypothetical protein